VTPDALCGLLNGRGPGLSRLASQDPGAFPQQQPRTPGSQAIHQWLAKFAVDFDFPTLRSQLYSIDPSPQEPLLLRGFSVTQNSLCAAPICHRQIQVNLRGLIKRPVRTGKFLTPGCRGADALVRPGAPFRFPSNSFPES